MRPCPWLRGHHGHHQRPDVTTTAGTSGGSAVQPRMESEAVDGGFPWACRDRARSTRHRGSDHLGSAVELAQGPSSKGTATGGDAGRGMTLQELRQRVGSQLVQTDDAIKTSTEEVGFAIAEFGEAEAAPFQKALEEAHRELDEAFKLHRQFDDSADEQTQRLAADCDTATHRRGERQAGRPGEALRQAARPREAGAAGPGRAGATRGGARGSRPAACGRNWRRWPPCTRRRR